MCYVVCDHVESDRLLIYHSIISYINDNIVRRTCFDVYFNKLVVYRPNSQHVCGILVFDSVSVAYYGIGNTRIYNEVSTNDPDMLDVLVKVVNEFITKR